MFAVLGVVLAAGTLVLGLLQVVGTASEAMVPAAAVQPATTSSATPPVAETIAARRTTTEARREAVGTPRAYPGSLRAAPPAAIAAYQRAEVIINQATDCGLDWTVLAAIGRVESNHGRGLDKLDHRLTRAGLVKPALVGKPLNGRRGTSEVADTDLGKLDGNKRWDAPVGPMGLLPSTWTTVAVDADGDGARRVQDVDDAALAAAVLLCSGVQDGGSTTEASRDGRSATSSASGPALIAGATSSVETELEAALRRYHPGKRFVSTVLALAARYQRQAATVPPLRVPPGGVPMPELPAVCHCDTNRPARVRPHSGHPGSGVTRTPKPSRDGGPGPSPTPTDPTTDPTDDPTCTTEPTDPPTDEPSDEPTDEPSEPVDCEPTDDPTDDPTDAPTTEQSTEPTSTP